MTSTPEEVRRNLHTVLWGEQIYEKEEADKWGKLTASPEKIFGADDDIVKCASIIRNSHAKNEIFLKVMLEMVS